MFRFRRALLQTSANSLRTAGIMSNNNASSSSVAVAQKAVKQLRLEAKIRRINVRMSPSTINLDECWILRVHG